MVGLKPSSGCVVPTGLAGNVWLFPTLKRGANNRCAYGAGFCIPLAEGVEKTDLLSSKKQLDPYGYKAHSNDDANKTP
jgi:hypothetical protein